MRNIQLKLVAAIPLLLVIFFLFAAFIQGNTGLKMDKTQHGLLVRKNFSTLNPIQQDDLITSLHGVPYYKVLGFLFAASDILTQPVITLERDGREHSYIIVTKPFTISALTKLIWPHLLLLSFFLMLAFIAESKAPRSVQVKLFFLMLCGLSTSIAATLPSSLGILVPAVISLSFLILAVSNWISFGIWLHFVCRFPANCDLLQDKKWPFLIIYLLPPLVVISISFMASGLSPVFWGYLQRFRNVFLPFFIVASFCKHWWDYRRITLSQHRNQLKLLLATHWLTFAPYLFLYLIPNILFNHPLISFRLILFSFFILPIAYLTGLLRYGLFDIDRIISKSIAFITLITCLTSLYSLLLTQLKRWFFDNQILSEEIFLLFFIIVVVGFHPIINRVEKLINRLFFRQTTVPSEVIHQFSNKISSTLCLSELIDIMVEELPERINVYPVAIMLLYDGHSHLYPDNIRFGSRPWPNSALVKYFRDHSVMCLQTDHTAQTQNLKRELDEIQQAGFVIILPMRTATGLSGFMFVGSKSNDRLFTKEDIQLMSSLANQGAIAFENARRYESLIASRKEIENLFVQRVQYEKMAIIGEMTATVAHELKNPLGIIHSSAQYLLSEPRSKKMKEEMLSYIIDEVEHVNTSIDSLLGLVRQKPPKFEQISFEREIPALIKKWQSSSNHNPEITILYEIDKYTPLLHADLRQINQVLLNLIRNSEEMMADEGAVSIKICGNKEQIMIRVIDNGPGIDDKIKNNLFMNFSTTKKNGLGLGLVVCRQIIGAHNGTIELYNREGGGAEAKILLPVQPLPATALFDL